MTPPGSLSIELKISLKSARRRHAYALQFLLT